MDYHADTMLPPELLNPIWDDIRKLEAIGQYKEAFMYLRAVTDEIGALHQACIGICFLLEKYPQPWNSLQTLLAMVNQHLAPVTECSKLMYLESLRMIMEAVQQALSLKSHPMELQSTITSLCSIQNNRLFSRTDIPGFDIPTPVSHTGCNPNIH